MKNFSARRPGLFSLAFAALLGLSAGSARAAAYTWNSGAGNDSRWGIAANWVNNQVPATPNSNDTAIVFTAAVTAQLTSNEDISGNFRLNSLTFNNTSSAYTLSGGGLIFANNSGGTAPTLTQQNANVAVTVNNPLRLDNTLTVGGAGALTLGGAIDTTGSNTGLVKIGADTVTLTAANTYTGGTTISAGTLQLGNGTTLNGSVAGNIVDNATLIFANPNAQTYAGAITGAGSVTKLGAGVLTLSGTSNFAGTLEVSAGTAALVAASNLTTGQTVIDGTGAFTQSDGVQNAGNLFVGFGAGPGGAYTLGGGSLAVQNVLVVGSGGTGTFTQNAGVVTAAGGVNYNGVGTYNLNGGTLTAPIVRSANAVASTFNFNGGTLQASAPGPGFLQGLTVANVQTGGAKIDTNGFDLTVAQPLLHDTTPGAAATDGGLTKLNAGTLTLTGASTFTGPTTVNSGTLQVGTTATPGSVIGGSINLAQGTTLTINAGSSVGTSANLLLVGTSAGAGPVTVNLAGGTLATGVTSLGPAPNVVSVFNQTGGTFTAANRLALGDSPGDNSTYNLSGANSVVSLRDLSIGSQGSGTFNQTSGAVTLTGGQLRVALNSSATGVYNLSGGSLTVAPGNEIIGSGGTATFTQSGTSTNTALFLQVNRSGGAATGTYNLDGGTLTISRLDLAGGIFNFNGGTLRPADSSFLMTNSNGVANVRNGGAIFDTQGFTAQIVSPLVHSTVGGDPATDGGLTKLGVGTLSLQAANTYTGPTAINGGVLVLQNAGALGTVGPISFGGGALQFSSFNETDYSPRFSTAASQLYSIDTNTRNITFATGLTSSGGSLTKLGGGTLTLTGASTYTGFTTVTGGTLAVAPGGSLTGTSGIAVNTGATLAIGGTVTTGNAGATGSLSLNGTAASPANATLAAGGSLTISSARIGDNAGAGIFTQTGGTFTLNDTTFGLDLADKTGSSGTYNLGGGTLNAATATVGGDGQGTMTQTGGTFNVGTPGNVGSGFFFVGQGAGTGSYTLGGGTLLAGTVNVGSNNGGTSGAITQTGGAAFVGSGGLTLRENATYTLGGGTLTTRAVQSISVGAVNTFNFAGGVLRASASNPNFFTGFQTANVQAGGAVIDTNGFNPTIVQNLLHDTAAGAAALDGGLTKLGAGTLTLTGTNTFTGPLNINAGTLAVTSEAALGAAASALTVGGNGQLLFTADATLARTYNLGVSTLAATAGSTLTLAGATVNGGFLGAGAPVVLGDGTTLNNTRLAGAAVLNQNAGTAAFNNVTVGGAGTFTQAAGATVNSTGEFITTPNSTVTVGGTFNAAGGGSVSGGLTVNGTVNATGAAPLSLDGNRGTTINTGGNLNAIGGSSIELGNVLNNNGNEAGPLNVNQGGIARGSGFYAGPVSVNPGGQLGGNAAPAAPAAVSSFWHAVNRPAPPQPFIGPVLSTTPTTTNFGSLTLNGGGSVFFNLQNTQEAPGVGYDLVNVTGGLTLAAGTTPGTQIVVRLNSLDQGGNNGEVFNFDGTKPYQFTLVQTGGGITGYAPGEFLVNTGGFFNSTRGGTFSVVQQGNNLVLVFAPVPVPEPAAWAVLIIAGAAGGGWLAARRRKTRHVVSRVG